MLKNKFKNKPLIQICQNVDIKKILKLTSCRIFKTFSNSQIQTN